MGDWNTSSSRDKNAFERLMGDPKKLTVAVVGLGVLLTGVWAMSFLDRKVEPESAAVAFTLPDPSKALPSTGSGNLVAKSMLPSKEKPSDAEADALRSLQTEAVSEVSDSPANEADDVPVEGADERGAPGGPIAEAAGWLGGTGGGSGGGGISGGVGAGSGSGASMQAGVGAGTGVGPGTGVADGGPAARQVQGAVGSVRTVASGGRSLRSGTMGGTHGAASPGVGSGVGSRFAPSGATGNAFGAGPGVSGGSTVGGGGASVGGGGAGFKGESGGGGVADAGPGVNPANPGGGGNPNNPGPGGPGTPVKAKKRSEVNKDAAEVLKTATSYRTDVVAKIMVEEKADVQLVGARSKQAAQLLKADISSLKKTQAQLAAFPDAAASLAEAGVFLGDHTPRFSEGGAALTNAARPMSMVPAKCGTKVEHATAAENGDEVDPKGVLQAHRDAVSALRRVAVARVSVAGFDGEFAKEWPGHEATIRATDPKLADVYKKAALDLDKDLKQVVTLLPATLYPTKGKGKAAKIDMAAKLKPIRGANEKGIKEFERRHQEQMAAHRAYPQTEDLGKAENSAWLAVEGARQVEAQDFVSGVDVLTAAETSLPALVVAGENAAEAYMESCDHWAALKRLAKDAPK